MAYYFNQWTLNHFHQVPDVLLFLSHQHRAHSPDLYGGGPHGKQVLGAGVRGQAWPGMGVRMLCAMSSVASVTPTSRVMWIGQLNRVWVKAVVLIPQERLFALACLNVDMPSFENQKHVFTLCYWTAVQLQKHI